MTLMIPMLQQDLVQNWIPKTPMLLDTILMILMDAKVLLDLTLMLHQEKVPTLTPTIPMPLDMIPMIPMVAKVHLGLIPMILIAEKVQNTIQMILTQETSPNTTLTILMLPIARDLVIPTEQDQEKDQAMIPIQLV